MKLVKIQALFLVSIECWECGLKDFLIGRTKAPYSTTIQKFAEALRRIESPVFMDRFNIQDWALGTLSLRSGELLFDTEVPTSVMAMLWHPRVFVMIVELGQQELAQVSINEILAIPNKFGSQVQAIISSSVTSAPQYLGTFLSFLETSMASLAERANIQELLQDLEQETDCGFADIYWTKADPHALLVINPDAYGPPTHSLIVGNEQVLRTVTDDLRKLFWYIGTRAAANTLIRKTEKEVDAALCIREALRRIPQTPTVQSLLASLYPRYRDPFERVNDAILKVNRATQTLTELTAEFASTYQVFQFDPWWRPGQFVLFDFYAARGHLVEVKRDEIGQLMLIDYLKRSALQTMSFYEQRFGLARQDLAALLLSLQTMASVRSAQHANILNKLILVLTVVSAGLALMQVLSSTSLWIGLNPGLIGALLTLMFFLIMVAAYRKVRTQQASEDPSTPKAEAPFPNETR